MQHVKATALVVGMVLVSSPITGFPTTSNWALTAAEPLVLAPQAAPAPPTLEDEIVESVMPFSLGPELPLIFLY